MSTPLGIVLLLVPSLVLGVAFVILAVCIHHRAPGDRRLWSHVALVFATVYAVFITMNYYVQLTFVLPHRIQGTAEGVRVDPFRFVPFDSFHYSVDLLGYSFLSLATLVGAFSFGRDGLEGVVRRFLVANGLLLPFLALQIYYPPLIWIAAL